MTIRIKITHDQPDYDRSIRIIGFHAGADAQIMGELHPGQSGEYHVHDHLSLGIEEIDLEEFAPADSESRSELSAEELNLLQIPVANGDQSIGAEVISDAPIDGMPVITVAPAVPKFEPIEPVSADPATEQSASDEKALGTEQSQPEPVAEQATEQPGEGA